MSAPRAVLLRRPLGRLGLVLSLTLVGGLAGGTYGAVAPPEYTARAYVVTTGETPDPMAFARAYGGIATSGPVLAGAATVLGAGSDDLDDVTASTSKSAPVIEIAAHNRSADRAAAVANAVGQALAAYGSERQSDVHVGLAVLAVATVPARPSSPDPPRELLIGTSAGLLAGAVAALFTLRRPVARPTFEDPAEIEGHLRIWRAQYGPRSVTAYRGAASLTEPPDWPSAARLLDTGDEPPDWPSADRLLDTGDEPPDWPSADRSLDTGDEPPDWPSADRSLDTGDEPPGAADGSLGSGGGRLAATDDPPTTADGIGDESAAT